ncbi:hypothetical protein RRG08_064557 [Elysia crispata]|uniref:Uncharacterized protein n=1 Tax=Elysia crispata TaxID=231223 RepID=A0AAE1B9F8_9GAST|nr:hypothetical protein RRG08_064557 [Elysia crispata]
MFFTSGRKEFAGRILSVRQSGPPATMQARSKRVPFPPAEEYKTVGEKTSPLRKGQAALAVIASACAKCPLAIIETSSVARDNEIRSGMEPAHPTSAARLLCALLLYSSVYAGLTPVWHVSVSANLMLHFTRKSKGNGEAGGQHRRLIRKAENLAETDHARDRLCLKSRWWSAVFGLHTKINDEGRSNKGVFCHNLRVQGNGALEIDRSSHAPSVDHLNPVNRKVVGTKRTLISTMFSLSRLPYHGRLDQLNSVDRILDWVR